MGGRHCVAVTKMSSANWPHDIGTCSSTPVSVPPPLSSCQIQVDPSVSSLSHHQDSSACFQAPHPSLAQKHWLSHSEALGDNLWPICPGPSMLWLLLLWCHGAHGLLQEACFPSVSSPPLQFIC